MPKLKENRVPSYRLHKQSGQAIVTLNGKDHLLGTHASAASKAAYKRLIAEWLSGGGAAVNAAADLSVVELVRDFMAHAKVYYRRPDGAITSEPGNYMDALAPVVDLYGRTNACDFGPLALKAVREEMIRRGWCRKNINRQVNRIKHVFKWAVGGEMLPASVYHGLTAVEAIKAGRTAAPESPPVKPVPDAMVDAIRDFVSSPVRAMLDLQRLTGMRPGEVCAMRGVDVDTTGQIWTYAPAAHKTAHHGHTRVVYLGPQAQAILKPFLRPNVHEYLFQPAESEAQRREQLHAARKTALSCGNRPGSNRQRGARRRPGKYFTTNTYNRSIARACAAAFPLPDRLARRRVAAKGRKRKGVRYETPAEWRARIGEKAWKEVKEWRRAHHFFPHQLRHSAGTRLRKEFGLELARVVLGHRTMQATEIYAEQDLEAARAAVMKIG